MTTKHNLPDPKDVFGDPNNPYGPIPHYPNWRYYCPICDMFWECDVKHSEDFATPCFDCLRAIREEDA